MSGVIGYLKRLVSSLAAYQVADIVSKFIAVLLLPVYTQYISPSGYGVVELLATGVIFISIVIRFGIIEAFLRYYFADEDLARRDALIRRCATFLLISTTVAAGLLAAASAPLSKLVLGHRDVTTFLIAVLGVWTFTNLELAYGLLRVDERIRTYAIASLTNVGLTITASLILVVGLGDGARGLLIGNYGASTLVLLGLWFSTRQRLRGPRGGEAESDSRSCCISGCPRCRRRSPSMRSTSLTATTSSTPRELRSWACTRSRSNSPGP